MARRELRTVVCYTPSMPRPVKVRAPAPAFAFTAAQLRLHVERLGAQRVADVLRVTVAALEPLLAGRVEMTRAALRRLRQTPG